MKTEKIVYTPVVVTPQVRSNNEDSQIASSHPKSSAKSAAMLTAALLAMATVARADVKTQTPEIDPYDLSYESTNEFDRNWFRNYVNNYSDLKRYSRVDKDTLRTVHENDAVVDHVIRNGVHDVILKGYTQYGNLYPNGHDVPLAEQKYDSYEKYKNKKTFNKVVNKTVRYGWPVPVAAILVFLLGGKKSKDNDLDLDDYDTKAEAQGTKMIDMDD